MAEQILHFGSITMRVNGTGLLKMTLLSLDDAASSTLVPFTMATVAGKEPTRLCNFVKQRARLKGFTTTIDDYFKINRIIVFVKPIYTQFPGTE